MDDVLTPIKAIRAKCLDCCCGVSSEVRRCPIEGCSLWPYRMGKRPQSKNVKDRAGKTAPECKSCGRRHWGFQQCESEG